MPAEQQTNEQVRALKGRIKNLENQIQSQGRTSMKLNSIPVTWGSWIIISLILVVWLRLVFPVLQTGMELGQTIFGVLLVTFMSYFTYRVVMWLIGVILGRSWSLLALLPSSLLGWIALSLALVVLSLVWGQHGPSWDQIQESISKFWNKASEVLPIGAISKLNPRDALSLPTSNGDGEDVATPALVDNTGWESVPIEGFDSDVSRLRLDRLYEVQRGPDGKIYNVFPDGTVKQNTILRCWNKTPTLNPNTCNPALPCRTGNRPVEPYKGINIRSCPYEYAQGHSSNDTSFDVLFDNSSTPELSLYDISQLYAAVYPGLEIVHGPKLHISEVFDQVIDQIDAQSTQVPTRTNP